MTAVAGLWRSDNSPNLEVEVSAMLSAQSQYGPHGSSVAGLNDVAFGRALFKLLPEDRFDVQPLVDPSGTWMVVADLRIDNREELLDALGYARDSELSDSDILLFALCKWGEATLDRLVGDFAFAAWNAREQSLILARDTAGQRPLHYHVGKGFIAFASLPGGLFALPGIPRQLDERTFSGFIADVPRAGSSTFFRDISRVDPGQVVKITRSGVEARGYWRLPEREIRYPKDSDYIEAFREQLDRATRVRLRGTNGLVGAHLSAGLDSSSVAATAARLGSPTAGKVIAFTSAPRAGFSGPTLRGRIGDESALAAEVAALYPNMEHVVVRPEGVTPLDLLGRSAAMDQEPVGHPCNYVWWSAVLDEARARGISVMLTGEDGNLTTSAGGLAMLAEFVRKGQWLRWGREAYRTLGTGPSWKGILATSFGPWMPRFLWQAITGIYATRGRIECVALLHPSLRPDIEARAALEARGGQPGKDNRELRWHLLQMHEPGNYRKGTLARWGVDERDPTADRRLAEFCFALPAEQLYRDGVTRRLARVALADRLPKSILFGPRGYQYPGWYEGIGQAELDHILSELERGPAASLLDFQRLRELAADWPKDDWNSAENIATYRLAFLMALSAGAFANKVCQ